MNTKFSGNLGIWLAGVLDYAAILTVSTRQPGRETPLIKVTAPREELYRLQSITKCGTVRSISNGSYSWFVSHREDIEAILTATLPHLRNKKPQARLLLELVELVQARGGNDRAIPEENMRARIIIAEKLRRLNGKVRKDRCPDDMRLES